MIVKAEVCVPLGMNAVAGDLRAERVIRKCVCGPVVGRAQIPADRVEDGLCFLFGFGERGRIGGLLFLDAVDVAGGDGDILGIEVTLCAIGKFYFIPGVGGFRDRDSGVIADNADNTVICACTLAQVDVCRGLGADGAVCRGLGRRGRCGSGSNLDVLCVNVARGAVSKADGVPLGVACIRYGNRSAGRNDTLRAVICARARAEVDVFRRFCGLFFRRIGRRGGRCGRRRCRCGRCTRDFDVLRENVARGTVSKADGIPLGVARIRYGDGGAEGNDALGAVICARARAEIDVLRCLGGFSFAGSDGAGVAVGADVLPVNFKYCAKI